MEEKISDFTWCLCGWEAGSVGGPPAAAAVTLRSSEPEKDQSKHLIFSAVSLNFEGIGSNFDRSPAFFAPQNSTSRSLDS